MQMPILSGHPQDDVIERYVMKRLVGENLELFEQHLLVCHACQIRLTEYDDYAAVIRTAMQDLKVTQPSVRFARNVFVSHGCPSMNHVEAVCDLLDVLGLAPVVATYMPNLGLS